MRLTFTAESIVTSSWLRGGLCERRCTDSIVGYFLPCSFDKSTEFGFRFFQILFMDYEHLLVNFITEYKYGVKFGNIADERKTYVLPEKQKIATLRF